MNRIVSLILKALVTGGLLFAIGSRIDLVHVAHLVAAMPTAALLGAFTLLVAQTVVTAYRWWLIMGSIGVSLQPAATLKALFVSLTLNQCFPSYIGGDAYRVYWSQRQGFGVGACARGVLIDRISAVVVLVLLLAVFMPRLFSVYPSTEIRVSLGLLLAAGVAGTTAFLFFDYIPTFGLFDSLSGQLRRLSEDARNVLLGGGRGGVIIAMAAVIHLLNAAILAVFARQLHLPIGVVDCAMLTPVIMLLTALPISIAGWGVREGVFVGALAAFGAGGELAVALSVLFGLTALAGGLIGLIPLVSDWDELVLARRE